MPIPSGYGDWWVTSVVVWRSTIDYLGHMTAAHYPAIYEEVSLSFVCDITGIDDPSYATAQCTIDYRHEVLHSLSPVVVHVGVTRLDETSFDLTMVLLDQEGTVCGVAKNHYVAWDRGGRGRRSLDELELRALRLHLVA